MPPLLGRLLIGACLSAVVLSASGQSITDQFDKLERDEFGQTFEKARRCASAGDFVCSDKYFAAAARLATNQRDRTLLQQAMSQADGKKREAAEMASEQEEMSARQAQESRTRLRQQRLAEATRIQEAERAQAAAERRMAKERSAEIAQILQNQARVSAELSRTTRDIAVARAADQAEQTARRLAVDQQQKSAALERDRVKNQQVASANERAAHLREEEQRNRAAAQRKSDDEARTRRDQLLAQQRAEREEATRQRREAERVAKEAKLFAEQEGKKRYLAEMIRSVHLKASKCPDGAGHYYANGTRPRVKPEAVSCIDVHYEAHCPASNAVSRGVAHNYVGMSGCFGDTYQIEPKPACPVNEVQIRVTDVQPCG